LCSAWTPSSVTDSTSTWTWSCTWTNWGTTANNCSRPRAYCATQPSYEHAAFTTWTPTSTNQARVKWASSCWFTCKDNYTWDTCQTAPPPTYNYSWGEITITYWSTKYTIADKNAWATTIYTNQTFSSKTAARTTTINAWAWGLYQFWANDDRSINNFVTWSNSYSYDWKSPWWTDAWSANDWWVTSANASTATYSNSTSENQAKMKWPCDSGRHVPTTAEWDWLIKMWFAYRWVSCTASAWSSCSWSWDATLANFQSDLKLPLAGYRNRNYGSMAAQGSTGFYWSSSPLYENARNLYFSSSSILPQYSGARALGLSVRCFKN
jgi:hypothetical protein